MLPGRPCLDAHGMSPAEYALQFVYYVYNFLQTSVDDHGNLRRVWPVNAAVFGNTGFIHGVCGVGGTQVRDGITTVCLKPILIL